MSSIAPVDRLAIVVQGISNLQSLYALAETIERNDCFVPIERVEYSVVSFCTMYSIFVVFGEIYDGIYETFLSLKPLTTR